MLDFSGLPVSEFLVEVQVSLFLKYGVKAPVITAIDSLSFQYGLLSKAKVPELWLYPYGRDALSAAAFFINYPDASNSFPISNNEVVRGSGKIEKISDIMDIVYYEKN